MLQSYTWTTILWGHPFKSWVGSLDAGISSEEMPCMLCGWYAWQKVCPCAMHWWEVWPQGLHGCLENYVNQGRFQPNRTKQKCSEVSQKKKHTITPVHNSQSSGTVEYTNCTSAEGSDPPNKSHGYDTKHSDDEVPAILELWGMWGTPSLPLLPGPLWPGVEMPLSRFEECWSLLMGSLDELL